MYLYNNTTYVPTDNYSDHTVLATSQISTATVVASSAFGGPVIENVTTGGRGSRVHILAYPSNGLGGQPTTTDNGLSSVIYTSGSYTALAVALSLVILCLAASLLFALIYAHGTFDLRRSQSETLNRDSGEFDPGTPLQLRAVLRTIPESEMVESNE
ncbi:m162 [Muromegalovirus G4]|uniref:M162 n=1 Tax=Muromegalovirus G4 TaxID=524650 RepID=B3UXA9_MUHV1|nr:m162 [Muromegalovirus G4]QNL29308.1 m162 [Muromegalovirus G4]